MIKQNNNKKSYLFIFTILIMCILSIFALTYNSLLCTNVFAEETQETILNFNQLFGNNVVSSVAGATITHSTNSPYLSVSGGNITYNNNHVDYTNNISLSANHKYYIRLENNVSNIRNVIWNETAGLAIFSSRENYINIYTPTSNQNIKFGWFYYTTESPYNFTVSVNIIDLTLMYGIGNEPTIEDINNYNIFPTYYSYTASTPIIFSKDNQAAYQNGYNAALNDYLNSIETITSFSNSYANLTYAQLGGYTGTGITRGVDLIDNKEHYAVFYDADTLALAPFIIQNNTKVTITFEYFEPVNAPQASDYPVIFEMYAVNGNDLFKVWEYRASNWTQATSIKEIQFVAPFTMNGLYISVSERFCIVNMTAIYTTNDLGLLIQNSNESGYNAGYLQGKKDGEIVGRENALATGKVWQNGWDFISSTFTSIGNIFDIKIFGDIPLWTFIAIPLLFGLIIFLFRISGGN